MKDGERADGRRGQDAGRQQRRDQGSFRRRSREEQIAAYVAETSTVARSGFETAAPGQPAPAEAHSPARGRANGRRIGNAVAGFEQDPKCGFERPRDFILTVLEHGDRDVQAASDGRLRFLAAAGSDEQGAV